MGRPRTRRPWREQEAASQAIGLLMAGMILTGGISTILWESREQNITVAPDDISRDMQAAIMLDMLLDSQGVGWENGPDGVDRLGLATTTGGLNLSSLLALESGLLEGGALDAKVDHDELVASMGLDPDAYGMQLRVTPKIMRDGLFVQRELATMRTALVADWTNLAAVSVPVLANDTQMVVQARAKVDLSMAAAAAQDRALLAAMGMDYDDRVHLTADAPQILVDMPWPLPDLPLRDQVSDITLLAGDVYPDDRDYLPGALEDRLQEYELLVVGSGVDHRALHDDELKMALQAWVEAGGHLIVLGSTSSTQAWLNPMLTAAAFLPGLAGPMTASVATHEALTRPSTLAWQQYGFPGSAWQIQAVQTPGHTEFTHPLVANGHSVLAISKAGTFGNGSVSFTSLPVSVLFDAGGIDEATRFLTNVIVYTALPWVQSLTIVFGEPVPGDLPVGFAYRSTQSTYPGYGIVALDAELLLWKKAVSPAGE